MSDDFADFMDDCVEQLQRQLEAEQEKVRVLKKALEGVANYQSTEVFAGKVLEIDTDPEFLKRLAREALAKVSEVKE